MDIQVIINKISKRCKTLDPILLAKSLGIIVLYENLGNSINGYYNKILRQKFIHVNISLPKHLQYLTIAHELGHAIMHPDANTPFLRTNTFLSVDKLEIEANTFAVLLLIHTNELIEHIENGYTIDNIASIYGFDRELIKLRLKYIK